MPNSVVIDRYRLQYAFDFGERELNANRHGRLTAKQQHNLQEHLQTDRLVLLLMGVFGVGSGLWAVMTITGLRKQTDIIQALLILLVSGVVYVVITVSIWRRWQAFIQDKRSGHALSASGIGIIRAIGSKDVKYWLYVGDQRFTLSAGERDALLDGKCYRIYYLPQTYTILSIEIISPRPSFRIHYYAPKKVTVRKHFASTRRVRWQPADRRIVRENDRMRTGELLRQAVDRWRAGRRYWSGQMCRAEEHRRFVRLQPRSDQQLASDR